MITVVACSSASLAPSEYTNRADLRIVPHEPAQPTKTVDHDQRRAQGTRRLDHGVLGLLPALPQQLDDAAEVDPLADQLGAKGEPAIEGDQLVVGFHETVKYSATPPCAAWWKRFC